MKFIITNGSIPRTVEVTLHPDTKGKIKIALYWGVVIPILGFGALHLRDQHINESNDE